MSGKPGWAFLGAIVGLCATAAAGFGQQATLLKPPPGYFTFAPLREDLGSSTSPMAQSFGTASSSGTVPLWNFTVTSPLDGNSYSGTMVGRSPFFHGARTTNVGAVVVPLAINMPDGGVFDPTVSDGCTSSSAITLVQQSPLLTATSFTFGGTSMGTTQYVDAFQRANFWTHVSVAGSSYHTVLSPITTLAPVTVNVPSGSGSTNSSSPYGGCGNIGVIDIGWFDSYLEGTLIPALSSQGVGPTIFPVFVLHDVVMTYGTPSLSGNCCIIGYHAAFGYPYQFYAPVDFDTTGIFGSSETPPR